MQEAEVFRALSDPIRLQILESLAKNKGCVQLIGENVGKKQPNVSQHLRVLRLAGLVEAKREGRKICYCIKDKRVMKIIKLAKEAHGNDRP
jgi:ArsR family transcriptional regulator, zinc-responsive transcriptional repressor